MKRCIMLFILLLVCVPMMFSVCSASNLEKGNWSERNYRVLTDFIDKYGTNSANYDSKHKPYAVFDWDNTSIFGDCEETLFMYYINNLLFNWTAEEFAKVLAIDIPFGPMKFANDNGRIIERDQMIFDIANDYAWLRENYEGYKGAMTLEEIHTTPQFNNFRTKLFAMFAAVDATCGTATADLWEGRLLVNVTEDKLREYAYNSVKEHLSSPIKRYKWSSPKEGSGKTSVVTAETDQSLRIQPDMSNLFTALRENGFDVYICSASPESIVEVFASNPEFGYGLPEDAVHGVKFMKKDGIITTELAEGHVMTWGPGKVVTIQREFIDKKGYAPLLIGGDSDGDFDMLSQITGLELGLIINRAKGGKIGSLCTIAARQINLSQPRYILQGRDENKGCFIPAEGVILYGSQERILLKKQ